MSDYVVQPSPQASGSIRVPGDKSISHRALMLGGIAEGISEVTGFLESEDCLATMKAMRALGVRIDQTGPQAIRVSAKSLRLTVQKEINHDPSCGARQWFHPLAEVADAAMGTTSENAFSGSTLGTKWSDPNKRSSFFGTFSY